MRLWTVHPRYLDVKGLLALWRESLLARQVLDGKTIGYRNHPQLERFRLSENPQAAINQYLNIIYMESQSRGYSFDKSKIQSLIVSQKIKTSTGQVLYEWNHLRNKIKEREPLRYQMLVNIEFPETNPLFELYEGEVEPWEKTHA